MALRVHADLPGPCLHVLVQDYLSAHDRLLLFQVSRGIAAIVLQHAANVTLRLSPSSKHTAWEQHAQQQAMDAILALAPGVGLKVTLEGQPVNDNLCSMWAGRVVQQVELLSLTRLTVTAEMLQSQLQLQCCSQLQTLDVGYTCKMSWSMQQMKELAGRRTRILPPSLTSIDASSNAAASEVLVQLAGPQLTHLQVCCSLQRSYSNMLCQLTHVNVSTFDDTAMHCLIELPGLTHVTAVGLELEEDHTSKQPRWQQLTVKRSSCAGNLQRLPLWCIQQLVLHAGISCRYIDMEAAWQLAAHLASCPKLVCVPEPWGYLGRVQFGIDDKHPAELVTICGNSMSSKGCLDLGFLHFHALQQLLLPISALRQQVGALQLALYWIDVGGAVQFTTEQQVQILQQLVDALPQHVKEIVLYVEHVPVDMAHMYASAIVSRLHSNQQVTKLVMLRKSSASIPSILRKLVHSHAGRMVLQLY